MRLDPLRLTLTFNIPQLQSETLQDVCARVCVRVLFNVSISHNHA